MEQNCYNVQEPRHSSFRPYHDQQHIFGQNWSDQGTRAAYDYRNWQSIQYEYFGSYQLEGTENNDRSLKNVNGGCPPKLSGYGQDDEDRARGKHTHKKGSSPDCLCYKMPYCGLLNSYARETGGNQTSFANGSMLNRDTPLRSESYDDNCAPRAQPQGKLYF